MLAVGGQRIVIDPTTKTSNSDIESGNADNPLIRRFRSIQLRALRRS